MEKNSFGLYTGVSPEYFHPGGHWDTKNIAMAC